MTTTISDVTQDIHGRYTWTITDGARETEYRTNRDGDGMFVWTVTQSSPGGEWQQMLGTGQFQIHHLAQARSKIRAVMG